MTRGVFNWSFHDVVSFLKDRNFKLNHTEGSHHYYVGIHGGEVHQVSVPFHGTRTFKPRTLNGIIRQSGILKEEWLGY